METQPLTPAEPSPEPPAQPNPAPLPAMAQQQVPSPLAPLATTPLVTAPLGSGQFGSGPLDAEQIANVEALLAHVVENGLDADGTVVAGAMDALARYRAAGGDDAQRLAAAQDALRAEIALVALTGAGGITGRSIRSSAGASRHLGWIRALGLVLIAAAVTIDITVTQALGQLVTTTADHIQPLLWGAIGAIVFLLKTITDKASDLSFDERKLCGLPERILLGALCGLVVVSQFGAETDSLTRDGAAFLAGLGTKAVYAAFETLVNAVAERVGPRKTAG